MPSQTITATQARNNFSDIISQVIYQNKQFYIHRKGKRVAAIIPADQISSPVSDDNSSIQSTAQQIDQLAGGFKLGAGLSPQQMNQQYNQEVYE